MSCVAGDEVDRGTTRTDLVDRVESGWTEEHERGLGGPWRRNHRFPLRRCRFDNQRDRRILQPVGPGSVDRSLRRLSDLVRNKSAFEVNSKCLFVSCRVSPNGRTTELIQ